MPDERDLTEEIGEMLLPGAVAALGDADEEPVEEEAAEEEAPEEEAASEEEEEIAEEGDEEEEEVAEEPSEVAQLRTELAAMREALAATAVPKEEKEVVVAEPEVTEVDFLDGIDVEDIQEDPKAFNAILNKVLREGVRLGRETVLRDIPNIVTYNVRQQAVLKESSDKFYADNADLVPFKRVVGAVAEEIMSANPELSIDELFEKSAIEARSRLALAKKAGSPGNGEVRKPATTRKSRGGRKPSTEPKRTPMEADVLAMIKGV